MIPKSRTLALIPAYNAADTLEELIARLSACWPLESTLFVDDGSNDDTGRILVDSGATFIRFGQNRGKGAALKAGYRWARDNGYTDVVTLDADLQHAPEEIAELLRLHETSDAEVTVGTRFPGGAKMPRPRQLSNFLTSLVVSIFSKRRIRDCQSGFRIVSIVHSGVGRCKSDGFMLEAEQLFVNGAGGVRIAEAPVSCVYEDESSHIRPVRDTLSFFALIWRRMWY